MHGFAGPRWDDAGPRPAAPPFGRHERVTLLTPPAKCNGEIALRRWLTLRPVMPKVSARSLAALRRRGLAYAQLMRLDRPAGTMLLLWPTLAALWIAAAGMPPTGLLAAFVCGVFLMRACGCVINDIADRHVDGLVERTAQRPLATGRVTVVEAFAVFAALAGGALAVALTLNAAAVRLALIGMALAAVYPFAKRWTHLPQVVLGIAFSWGIPMAFAAVGGAVPPLAWLLFGGSLLWVVAYDTEYAMADRRDDEAAGVRSLAVLLGHADRWVVGALQCAALAAFVGVGVVAGYGVAWLAALAVAAFLLGRQQWMLRGREPAACLSAFRSNAWVGLALFVGAFLEHGLAEDGQA